MIFLYGKKANLSIRSRVTDLWLGFAGKRRSFTVYTLIVWLSTGVCSTSVLTVLSLQRYLDPYRSRRVTLSSALLLSCFQFLLLFLLLPLQEGQSFLQFSFPVVVTLPLFRGVWGTTTTTSRFVFVRVNFILVWYPISGRLPEISKW